MSSTTPTQNFKIGEWQTTGKPVWNKTTIWQKIVKKIKNIRTNKAGKKMKNELCQKKK